MSKPFDAHALEQIDSPEASAAAYFSHFRSSRANDDDYAAFEDWHARDEAHRIAWARVQQEWNDAGKLRQDPRILAMREQALARPARKRWAGWPSALAASLALLVAGGIAYDRYGPLLSASNSSIEIADARTISTGTGQQTNFRMVDGSTVMLNTNSLVSITETDSKRATILKKGEAFFEVAKNDRKPFTVEAGPIKVTAVGTAFAVREDDGAVLVTLEHGRVRVDIPATTTQPARAMMLHPGMALRWQDGDVSSQRVETSRRLSWRDGMIDFDAARLVDAVKEVNRYSQQEIIIESASLARRTISGSFRIGATHGFLQSLEAAGIATAKDETPTRITLVAR